MAAETGTSGFEHAEPPMTQEEQAAFGQIVRLQMGRLRQKPAEYGRTEGSDDPYIIDLPKDSFTVSCMERPFVPAPG